MNKITLAFLVALFVLLRLIWVKAENSHEELTSDSIFVSSDINHLFHQAELLVYTDPAKGVAFAREAARLAMLDNDDDDLTKSYYLLGENFRSLQVYDSAVFYLLKHIRRLPAADSAVDFATLNMLGASYHFLNRQDSALYYLETARDIALAKDENEIDRAAVFNNLAMVYDAIGNFDVAVDYYMDALKTFEKLGRMEDVATLYNNIGAINQTTGNFGKSVEYFTKSLEIAESLNNHPSAVRAMINLGVSFKTLQQYEEAKQALQDAINLSREAGLEYEVSRATYNLGTLYFHLQDYANARSEYVKSYNLSEKLGITLGKLYNCLQLAELKLLTGNLPAAEARLKEAEEIIDNYQYYSFGNRIFKLKSELEEAKGNYQQALHYYKMLTAFEDSVSEAKNVARMQEMLLKYETEKKSLENQQLRDRNVIQKKTIQNQQLLVGLLVVIFIFFIGHLITIIRSRKKLTRVNKELIGLNNRLSQKRERLAKANETKDKLFSVIAHDLRSPFNSLLGFLELLIEDFDSIDDAEKLEILQSVNKQAVTTFGLLENLLQWSMSQRGLFQPELRLQPLLPILNSQLEELDSRAKQKHLTIEKNVAAGIQAFVDENMTKTIFRNLINNSIKFTGRGGNIFISATTVVDFTIVKISDTGIGMSKEIAGRLFGDHFPESRNGTESEKGTGLGLMIVKDFVEKQHAKISVQSEIGRGSTFTIHFKSHDQ